MLIMSFKVNTFGSIQPTNYLVTYQVLELSRKCQCHAMVTDLGTLDNFFSIFTCFAFHFDSICLKSLRDFIGDIKAKLKHNDLKSASAVRKHDTDGAMRVYKELFRKFLEENALQNIDDKRTQNYLQKKRLIVLVDRRQYATMTRKQMLEPVDDEVFMYEPPNVARNIPNNAVPEWYIGASRMTVLPDMNFGDGLQHSDPLTNISVCSPTKNN